MNLFMKLSQKKLHLCLLLSMLGQAYAHTEAVTDATSTTIPFSQQTFDRIQQEDALYSELHSELLVQINMLESTCDTIGQIRANRNNFKVKDQNNEKADFAFLEIRRGIAAYKDENSLYRDRDQVIHMANFIALITDALDIIATKGIDALVSNTTQFKQKKRCLSITLENVKTLTPEDLKKLVTELTKDLKGIVQKADSLGLSTTNKVYRSVRSVWNRYYLGPILERAIAYPLIYGWTIFMMPESTLSALPGSTFNLKLKQKLTGSGEKPKEKFDTNKTLPVVDKIVETDKENRIIRDKNGKPVILEEKAAEKEAFVQYRNKNGKIIYSKPEPISKLNIDLSNYNGDLIEVGSKASQDPTIAGDTWLNKAIAYLEPVLTMEGGAYFKLPISIIAAKYIQSEYALAKKQIQKAKAILDDKLMGAVKQKTWTEVIVGTDRFKDVVGRDDIKAELNRVIDYVCNPEKFDRTSITVEKGFLFTGPSQNGKSAMVRAFANELTDALVRQGKPAQVRLWNISIQEIMIADKEHGKEPGLSYFIRMAESIGMPVVLAIDEFDMLSLQRDRDPKMLADVLTAMSSGLSASEKNMVIIIGLTNRPQNLDFALLQHGRFGKQFKFDKPTYKDRVDFFTKACEDRSMDPQRFDLVKLAQETEGVSFGTLLSVAKRAFLLAKMGNVGITQQHFERALDTEVKNIVFTSQELPMSKQEIIATHCAGKALVSVILQPTKRLCKVTTLPCTQEIQEEHVHQAFNWDKTPIHKTKEQNLIRYGNIFAYATQDTLDMEVHEELIKQCKIFVAGNIAQKVSPLKEHSFDKLDQEEALALARKITFEGRDNVQGLSKKDRENLLEQAFITMKTYEQEVTMLLNQNKGALTALTKTLLEKKIMTRAEVEAVIAAHQ